MTTFTGELEQRAWTILAACSSAPHDELNWICETTMGLEPARTVTDCLTVCAACPVRSDCLADALKERPHTTMGIWGATTMTERLRAMREARNLGASGPEARRVAAEMLELTLETRIDLWRQRTTARLALIVTPPQPACANCGQGWLWDDADQRCTRWCRKLEREHRQREVVAA